MSGTMHGWIIIFVALCKETALGGGIIFLVAAFRLILLIIPFFDNVLFEFC